MKLSYIVSIIFLIHLTEGSPGIFNNPVSNSINNLLSGKTEELKKIAQLNPPQNNINDVEAEKENSSGEEDKVNEALEQLRVFIEKIIAKKKASAENLTLELKDVAIAPTSRGIFQNITTRLNSLVKLVIASMFSRFYTVIGRFVLYPAKFVLQIIINTILPCGSSCTSIFDY